MMVMGGMAAHYLESREFMHQFVTLFVTVFLTSLEKRFATI